MSEIDAVFARTCAGDRRAFAEWMGRVERPLRSSLRGCARAVDVEAVMQETMLRMWIFAGDRGATLTGENASLRFAIGMARNVARSEARRTRREHLLPPEDMPEIAVEPDPPPDPRLRALILECLRTLARKPRAVLTARLEHGARLADAEVARLLRMTRNTFLQNIVRARRQMKDCLAAKGMPLEEMVT